MSFIANCLENAGHWWSMTIGPDLNHPPSPYCGQNTRIKCPIIVAGLLGESEGAAIEQRGSQRRLTAKDYDYGE